MTGFVGGEIEGSELAKLLSTLHEEPWYRRDRVEYGRVGIGATHHGSRDPEGVTVWQDGKRFGLVYGTITNRAQSGLDDAELFGRLLAGPAELLSSLDGSFLIAAADGESGRFVLGSDALGTRQCYYATDPFVFGTDVGSITRLLDDPSVDTRGVSDLLLIGHLWGDGTLVDGVSFLPSGSVLTYELGSGVEIERYLTPTFTPDGDPSYMDDLVEAYDGAVSRTAETISGELGFWLSGGLDSRTMAAIMAENVDEMSSYTYDANPANGSNLVHAGQVADAIGVENVQVELTPDGFADVFEDCVDLVNGMVGMTTFVNLAATFELPTEPSVLMEACGQGGMMGDGIGQSAFERGTAPEEVLYHAKHRTEIAQARRLLETEFDPMRTYRETVREAEHDDRFGAAMETYYRNYFPRCDFASNPIARSQAGTRVPLADSAFISAVTEIPLSDRVGSVPFTGGKIPAGTAHPKLELVRRMNSGLDEIDYERTRLPPKRPLWQHATGFVVATSLERLRERTLGDVFTYGGRSMVGEWYRTNDRFRDLIDRLLDSAAERPYFDADVIEEVRSDTRAASPERIGEISGIVTGEQWIRTHLD